MIYVSAFFFIVTGLLHLTGCIAGNKKLCTVTKPLLMPLLALTAVIILFPHLPGARRTLIFTVAALAWGTAGDIFLLYSGEKKFIAGALCFIAGHFFWIAQYAAVYTSLPLSGVAIEAACAAGLLTAAYFLLGKPQGVMGTGVIIYGAVLCVLVFTGITALYAYRTLSSALYLTGALLFFTSDSMLGYTMMKKRFPLSDFFIMATYIIAQTLLTAAVVLPQLEPTALK
jgi:uncharacterized membrane protein YhhN